MMLSEGAPTNLEGKWSKIFHFIQAFINRHVDALFKAGLVRLHDGTQAVITPQALIAIHEAFLPDPQPTPATVSIGAVIARANQIAKEHDASG